MARCPLRRPAPVRRAEITSNVTTADERRRADSPAAAFGSALGGCPTFRPGTTPALSTMHTDVDRHQSSAGPPRHRSVHPARPPAARDSRRRAVTADERSAGSGSVARPFASGFRRRGVMNLLGELSARHPALAFSTKSPGAASERRLPPTASDLGSRQQLTEEQCVSLANFQGWTYAWHAGVCTDGDTYPALDRS